MGSAYSTEQSGEYREFIILTRFELMDPSSGVVAEKIDIHNHYMPEEMQIKDGPNIKIIAQEKVGVSNSVGTLKFLIESITREYVNLTRENGETLRHTYFTAGVEAKLASFEALKDLIRIANERNNADTIDKIGEIGELAMRLKRATAARVASDAARAANENNS